jgi:hypothetical protein
MAFKMEPGRGNYAKTGKGVPMVFKQNPPVDPKSGRPKNTSGAFGGDTIMGDENNDGNMLTRAFGIDHTGGPQAFGTRYKPYNKFGTMAPTGRNSGAMVSDLKRMARRVYSGITGNDGADAPSWMQQK